MEERSNSGCAPILFLAAVPLAFLLANGLGFFKHETKQPPSPEVDATTSAAPAPETITLQFTTSEPHLKPKTPPAALAYQWTDRVGGSSFVMIYDNDPLPGTVLGRFLYLPISTRLVPKTIFILGTGEYFEYDAQEVVYAHPEVLLSMLRDSDAIATETSNHPAEPLPEESLDWPPEVAVLNTTGQDLMDQLHRQLSLNGKDMEPPTGFHDHHRPGRQDFEHRHGMMLGA